MAITWDIDIAWNNDNVLANGSFEQAGAGGADIWSGWTENAGDGTLANETTTVRSGSDAAKATAGASANTYVYQDEPVVSGAYCELTIWTAGDGTYGGRYQIYDVTNSADIVAITATGVTGTSYARLDVGFDVPATCTSVRVYLHCPATNTGIAYYDDITLIEFTSEESRAVHPLTITRGRGDIFSEVQAGKLTLTLNNSDGRFDPWNTASAIYPDVKPRRDVRVRLTESGTTYDMFRGKIDDIRPIGAIGGKYVTLTAYDGLRDMSGHSANVELQESVTTDVAIGLVLDDVGWPDSAFWRDFDTGDDTLTYFWCNQNARPAINDLTLSEYGLFFVANDGKATFLDRTAVITGTNVGSLDESECIDVAISQPWDLIRNVVIVKCRPVSLATATSEFVGNGDMEIGDPPSAWVAASATLDSYAGSVHGGSAAMSVAASANNGNGGQLIDVVPGDSYSFSGWSLRSAAGHQTRFRIRDQVSGSYIYTGTYADNAAWTQDTNTFDAPAACTRIRISCEVETSGETGYFDDISLTGVASMVWTLPEVGVSIVAGATLVIWADYVDTYNNPAPAKGVIDAHAYIDYTANAASDGSGADMTPDMTVVTQDYSQNAKLTLTNTHGSTTLYITKLQLRGKAITQYPARIIEDDTASQTDYGKTTLMVDVPWQQNVLVAESLADLLIGFYPDPKKALTVELEQRFPEMVQFDIMDRIACTFEIYDVYEEMRLGKLEQYTLGNMQSMGARFYLEPCDNSVYWLLGDAGSSELGETTRLGV